MRKFPPDCDHAAVGRWLRQSAMKGFQRGNDDFSRRYTNACSCGVNLPDYPNSVSLILTRDMAPEYTIGWHLSVCCVTERGYRGFNPDEGEHWLQVVFGSFASRAIPQPIEDRTRIGIEKDVRHWIIDCDWNDRTDAAVDLAGI